MACFATRNTIYFHWVSARWAQSGVQVGVLIPAATAGGSETQFHCDPGTCKSTLKENLLQCELKVARCDQAKSSRAASWLIRPLRVLWGIDSRKPWTHHSFQLGFCAYMLLLYGCPKCFPQSGPNGVVYLFYIEVQQMTYRCLFLIAKLKWRKE